MQLPQESRTGQGRGWPTGGRGRGHHCTVSHKMKGKPGDTQNPELSLITGNNDQLKKKSKTSLIQGTRPPASSPVSLPDRSPRLRTARLLAQEGHEEDRGGFPEENTRIYSKKPNKQKTKRLSKSIMTSVFSLPTRPFISSQDMHKHILGSKC